MTTIGTHYFVSVRRAEKYYKSQGYQAKDVTEKLVNEDIKIGRPPSKPGQRIYVNWQEGRYFIESPN